MTNFEIICAVCRVEPFTKEAEELAEMVNERLFSKKEYTDSQIIEEVVKEYAEKHFKREG